ncbi:MAG TPA: hypothetical protein VFT02_09095, partial [Pyrinomonadaceae bacterium]|nr:hypothetical protein [Pyrinomonadaceae bacterium]
ECTTRSLACEHAGRNFETARETLKQWIGEGCVLPFTFYLALVIACIPWSRAVQVRASFGY